MNIKIIEKNKKQFLPLLLLADEQEDMIDHYLERGTVFVLYHHTDPIGICVVTEESAESCELKNLAIDCQYQQQGYGQALLKYVMEFYKNRYQTMLVGTGESYMTISFYQKCGFVFSHKVINFFSDHYNHVIVEQGTILKDMIYLKKIL